MLIRLTRKIRLRVSRPLWLEIDGAPQLELRLPQPAPAVEVPPTPEGYSLRIFSPSDKEPLLGLLRRSDFLLSAEQLEQALLYCLPRGCFVVEQESTGALVSTMMARHLASPDHPFGGRIDWLSTDPDHRSLGLGEICARSATRCLMDAGFDNIRVTTDDSRLAALKIFLSIGFRPVLTDETRQRWRRIEQKLAVTIGLGDPASSVLP